MRQGELDHLDVGHRLDRLPVTALHLAAVTLCALGFSFDLFEIGLGNVLSAVFSAPPHALAPGDLSLLLSSVYVGAVVGAPLLGWCADRFGRRTTLAGVLLWLSVASLSAALSRGVLELGVSRVLAGLALGAYPPLMMAYLTDLLPPRRRGLLTLVCIAVASLGPAAGVFLVRWLTPLQPLGIEAWRWAFYVGTAGSALAGLLFFRLPESPRWLMARGRLVEAGDACTRFERSRVVLSAGAEPAAVAATAAEAPPSAPLLRGPWPRVAAMFLLSPWATVAFPLLMGAVLMQKGFKLSDTLLFVGLSTFGPFLGTLAASFVVDRIERRLALGACAVLLLVSGLVFVASDTPLWLILSSTSFGVVGSVYVSALTLYAAEVFPTRTRATSLSVAWGVNRVGAAVAPLVLLPLLRGGGAMAMFAVIAAALVASLGVLAFSPRGQQRQPVV